ncbi:MAG: hypothetical protein AAGH79_15725, partial [Bacteroidota bacterium]
DQQLLHELQQILLREDRAEVDRLGQIIDDPDLFKTRVEPIIREELERLRLGSPKQYRKVIEQIIEEKIQTSQQEIIQVIYPMLGSMIQKYIRLQFKQLRESLEHQVQQSLTRGLIGRIRYALFGLSKKEKEQIIANSYQSKIAEIYVIEQHSGLLIGSASRAQKMNMEVIAGMLTAIKAFVQDAFDRGAQEVNMIDYDEYSILIENHYSYYVAVAFEGAVTAKEEVSIRERITIFINDSLAKTLNLEENNRNLIVKQQLTQLFFANSKRMETAQRQSEKNTRPSPVK